jgi:methionine aminopeptidase
LIKLKREKDINAMERASKIVGETLEMSRELMQPGITTWEIDKKQFHHLKGIKVFQHRLVYLLMKY